MLIINPANGEILQTDDPTAYYGMGYRDATPEELDHSARVEEFGGFEQQAQAQLERVTRGATLGLVEGFGTDEENRARAEVSEELSPITSLAANILPDVGVAAVTGGLGGLATGAGRLAGRTALAEGAGLLRAGLAAGRAGGAAALAAESVGTGAVGAGQAAYAEGRELGADPGADAENALIWGGLNFGLGSFMLRRGAGAAADDLLEEGGELGAKELDDIAAAAEVRETAKGLPEESIPGTPGQIFDVEGAPASVGAPSAAAPPPDMSPEAQGALERSRARQSQGGSVYVPGEIETYGIEIPRKGAWHPSTDIDTGVAKMIDELAADGIEDIAEMPTAAEFRRYLFDRAADDEAFSHLYNEKTGTIPKALRQELKSAINSAVDDIDDYRLVHKRAQQTVFPDEGVIHNASAVRAPLDDVRLPDAEGMLDDAAAPDDPRLAALQPELDKLRTEGIAGLSLKDLRALPLEEGPGAAESAAKVAAFEHDETFLREGMLPSNNDRGRGGLPAISLFPGEPPALSNGRHRVTAARKAGREEIQMNVKAYDADGNTLWDYVGPVRVSEPKMPAAESGALARSRARQGQAGAVVIGGKLEPGGSNYLRRQVEANPELQPIFGALDESDLEKVFAVKQLQQTDAPDFYFDVQDGGNWVEVRTEANGVDMQLTFLKTPRGLSVQHDRLFPSEAVKGRWNARQYLRELAPIYRKMGIKEIRLPEVAEHGPVIWAKLGAEAPTSGDKILAGAKAATGREFASLEQLARDKAGAEYLHGLYVPGGPRNLDLVGWVLPLEKLEQKVRSRAGERGAVDLAGMLTSPMGNVIAAGAGAALGGAVGGNTESIAAGGALGFAASALGGRFGRAAARGSRRLEAAAVRRGEREAVEGGVERALRNASKSDAADVVERVLGPEPVKEADSFGRQRRLYINRKAIREVAGREMQKDLTELVENVRQVASVEKQAAVASHVSDNLTAQRAVAKGVAKQAAEFAGQLRAEAKAYAGAAGQKGLKYAISGQSDLVVDLMDHAKKIAQATDGKGLYQALDDFKRSAQEHKISLEGGRLNDTSSIHYDNLIPRVEAFANQLRQSLEDPSTWGRAGEMQRAYNSVISDRLLPHMKTFESAVLQKTHKGYDGLWKMEGWERKIDALLKGTDAGNRRHVGAMLDAMDELADVRRKFGGAKEADAIASKVSKVRRTMGLADELADAEERMHALGQIIGGGPMGGAFAGALMGGLPGAAIGAALPGAVRGFVMGDLIEAFQRLSGATDAAVQRGVDDWIRSSRVRAGGIGAKLKLPKMPQLSDEAKQLRDVAMRRGITQSMALFMGEDGTPHAAYRRLQDKLLDGEAFFADLSKEYGTLQKEAPEVFMMLAARADGDRRFLLQRMPPNVAVSMANPDGYPPSRDAIEDWATYVNAIRYPMRVARSIGSMRVQEAEALRERRPRVYELLQQRVIEGIQTAKRSGEQVDDVALAKINLLFPEVDGLASPVFSRELGTVVSDYNIAKRERERGGGSPSAPPDKRGQLPAQAMAQQGATFGVQG